MYIDHLSKILDIKRIEAYSDFQSEQNSFYENIFYEKNNLFKKKITRLDIESKNMNPIDRLFFLIRNIKSIEIEKRKINNPIERILFRNEIESHYYQLLSKESYNLRVIYRVSNINTIYYHNSPMLLNDPLFLSVSLFILCIDEWVELFKRDITHTYIKGTDARSISEMIHYCLNDGLTRSNSSYFTNFFELRSSVTKEEAINRSFGHSSIHQYINDHDFTITTLKDSLNHSDELPKITINNTFSHSEILKLFNVFSDEYSEGINDIAETFLLKFTIYNDAFTSNYDIKNTYAKEKKYPTIDSSILADFISFIKFLHEEKIFTSKVSARKIAIIIKELGYKGHKIDSIRKNIYNKANLSSNIKYDFKKIINQRKNKKFHYTP